MLNGSHFYSHPFEREPTNWCFDIFRYLFFEVAYIKNVSLRPVVFAVDISQCLLNNRHIFE